MPCLLEMSREMTNVMSAVRGTRTKKEVAAVIKLARAKLQNCRAAFYFGLLRVKYFDTGILHRVSFYSNLELEFVSK